MNKLIICSGDSFTAGDELAADLLIPGYTELLYKNGESPTLERKQIVEKYENEISKLWSDFDKKILYENECKKRSWPSYLQYILRDTKIINCAGPGLSNDEIVHRAIETYFLNKDFYSNENILVFIMATTYNRFGFPMYGEGYSEFNYRSYTIYHNRNDIKPKYLQSDFYNFFFRMK